MLLDVLDCLTFKTCCGEFYELFHEFPTEVNEFWEKYTTQISEKRLTNLHKERVKELKATIKKYKDTLYDVSVSEIPAKISKN